MSTRFILWMNCFVWIIFLSAFRISDYEKPLEKDTGIDTSKELSPEELVRELFVKGGCKNVSNIQPIGNLGGIGSFSKGESSISIKNGIILSTGHIENAEGPNVNRDKSGDFADNRGDRDLNILAGRKVDDAVGLEFDFVPLDSVINFKYVFASEEYCEFVGTQYNDVFGFFVSGPGIKGPFSNQAINVALIPDTKDYVSINSVNHITNSAYYIGNELPEDAEECGFPHKPSERTDLIQFDGFTTVLTVSLKLIPCETYHIRLVVGDLGDNYFDSAVFLKAKSFSIGGDVEIEAVAASPDKKVAEGCSDGAFVFSRVDKEDLEDPVRIPFLISSQSKAKEGEDFRPIDRTITIPAGEPAISMPVEILVDELDEGTESLIVELDYPCECITDTAFLMLTEPPEIQIDLPGQKICPGDTVQFQPTVKGGFKPYRYSWNTGDTTASLELSLTNPTILTLTVIDHCQQKKTSEVLADIREIPEVFLEGEQEICEGSKGALKANLSGIAPWHMTVLYPDSSSRTFHITRDNPFYFEVEEEGIYTVSRFSDKHCKGEIYGEAIVRYSNIELQPRVVPPSCYGKRDGRIEIANIEGNAPFTFEWSDENGFIEQVRQLGAGVYYLDVTDARGCNATFEVELIAPEPLGRLTYNCKSNNFSLGELKAQGGTAPYTYSIDGKNFQSAALFSQLNTAQFYNLTIKDANGCLIEQPFQVPNGIKDFVTLRDPLILKFGEKYRLQPELAINELLIDSITWLPSTNLTCDNCLRPIVTALNDDVLKIRVRDIFGCEDEAVTNLIMRDDIKIFIPSAFSPNLDGVNDRLTVFANATQIKQVIRFQIFDRWGNRIFESKNFMPNNYSAGWDGRINGKKASSGVYVYNVLLELLDDSIQELNGSVVLFRE